MQTDNHTKRNKKKYTLSIRSTEKYIGIQIANEQTVGHMRMKNIT